MALSPLQEAFISEARELLQKLESQLLSIEKGQTTPDAVNVLFRAAHTIKGSAGIFGYQEIIELTHRMEGVLDKARHGRLTLDHEIISLLLEGIDSLRNMIDTLQVKEDVPSGTNHDLWRRLSAYCDQAVVSIRREWLLSIQFHPDSWRHGIDPLPLLRRLDSQGQVIGIVVNHSRLPDEEEFDPETCYLGYELRFASEHSSEEISSIFNKAAPDCTVDMIPLSAQADEFKSLLSRREEDLLPCWTQLGLDEIPHLAPWLKENTQSQEARRPTTTTSSPISKENPFVRIETEKLDQLINLVGELVIANAAANLQAQTFESAPVMEAIEKVSSLVEKVRDCALGLRMVPINEVFQRFPRMVRDVSQHLGKDIALEISGADTEIDKSMIEKIMDPLTHILRNAMDHGIETPDIRELHGKAAAGRLELRASHESGHILIEVTDDGAGLNRARIQETAAHLGLIGIDADLSDNDITRLILAPGFSTADSVTRLSGRGVGLDIVKRNVEQLRGHVEIDSKPHIGTTVRLRLPLTLAIIDAFRIKIDKDIYVLPLKAIVEFLDFNHDDNPHRHRFVNLRGEMLPFIRLREIFRYTSMAPARENILVVKYGNCKFGLVVDHLLGEFQAVIKPLGKVFDCLRGIAGSTILDDGTIALILDIAQLLSIAVAQGSLGAMEALPEGMKNDH